MQGVVILHLVLEMEVQIFHGEDTCFCNLRLDRGAGSVDELGTQRFPLRAFPVLLDHMNGSFGSCCSAETSVLSSNGTCIFSWGRGR